MNLLQAIRVQVAIPFIQVLRERERETDRERQRENISVYYVSSNAQHTHNHIHDVIGDVEGKKKKDT